MASELSGISLDGEFSKAEVYYTYINSNLNYDDHSVHRAKKSEDGAFVFDKDKEITSVLLSADFDANISRKITLKIEKSGVNAE